MTQIPEIDQASVVMLGSFNPAIFHPAWFKCYKLIRDEEADSAEIRLTSPQFADFSTKWFHLQVLTERFYILTNDSFHFEPLRDLVLSIFSLLEHTPVKAIGLNRTMHFKMSSIEKWHSFGHFIAPKEIWKDKMKNPGLLSLVMQDKRDDPPGSVNVRIGPSEQIQPGIFFEVNNHYDLKDNNDIKNLLKIIKDLWDGNIVFAREMAENLLEREY
jgi:hypothetical protein